MIGNEQWCANFLIIDKAFWVLDLESIELYCMVVMSNILQSSLSSCWRVLLQTFLSPDSAIMSTSAIVMGALRWMQIPPISCSTNCVSALLLFAIDTFLKSSSSEDSENEVFTLPHGFQVECVGVLVLLVECVGVLVNLQSRIQV